MSRFRSARALAFLLLALAVLWSILLIGIHNVQTTSAVTGIFSTKLEQFLLGAVEHQHSPPPYQEDVLCRACRHAVADPRHEESERCGVYIQREVLQHGNIAAAGTAVARRFPKGCRACRHDTAECDKRFWRYDAAAPVIEQSSSNVWLTTQPNNHRLPDVAVDNVTHYFLDDNHVFPAAEYFMSYNPSIVVLPTHQRDLLRNNLNADESIVYYLASFRVSNQHYCFHPADRKRMAGGTATTKSKQIAQDYLGLAILNADLQTVLDVTVDVKHAGFPAAQDFRLFVLDNQIYISSYDLLAPIWLTTTSSDDFKRMQTDASPARTTVLAPNVYGHAALFVHVGTQPSCAPCNRQRGFCGKNFNYFADGSFSNHHEAMVEIWPTDRHMIRKIDLRQGCQRGLEPETIIDNSSATSPAIMTSFATVEEVEFPALRRRESILTRGRGSACCIPMQHNNRTIFVGIQHSKTPSQRNKQLPSNLTANHYLSSLYAFETTLPYKIVAQSGWFCLGFPSNHSANPLVRATSWRKLVLGNRVFDCPRIHFVSGMTVKADDPTTVIVAYGINDCVSRMVQIKFSEFERLLFGDMTNTS